MHTYAILRRNLCSPDELAEVDRCSQAELDRRPDELRKIRSYVFEEPDGSLGAICVYDAASVEAVRDHAANANLKADAILPLTAIDVHRPDPERLIA